jgi:phage tail tape-measure protein
MTPPSEPGWAKQLKVNLPLFNTKAHQQRNRPQKKRKENSSTTALGADVGVAVGDAVGAALGDAVGADVGTAVGEAVGAAVGVAVGEAVGVALGAAVGDALGAGAVLYCVASAL